MFKLYCIQVWAGTEACEPVTWQECKLVPKDVKFIVPEINCTDGQEVRSCSGRLFSNSVTV